MPSMAALSSGAIGRPTNAEKPRWRQVVSLATRTSEMARRSTRRASRCSRRCVTAAQEVKAAGDEAVGVSIIKRALGEPLRLIAANAGHEGAVVLGRVRELKADEGFSALTEKYENLVDVGVIGPTKVVRSALQNAASIASLLLTTEAIICEIPEAKGEKRSEGMAAGGDMY